MSVFDTTQTTTTSLPSWFSDAQKDIATKAGQAASAATPFNETAAQGAIDSLTGTNNPFTSTIGGLQNIMSGAANPWLPSGEPNKQTALGGLFAAQNAQLNQMLPGLTAKEGAVGIGSGGFGSLRGQTATQTARGGALTALASEQMKAALDAQNQAINAGSAIGNIGSQYGTLAQNLTKMQQEGGLPTLAAYENIIGSMAPTLDKTTKAVTSDSAMANLAKSLSAIQSSGKALSDVLNGTTGIGWLDQLGPALKNKFAGVVGDITGATWNDFMNWIGSGSGQTAIGGLNGYDPNAWSNWYNDTFSGLGGFDWDYGDTPPSYDSGAGYTDDMGI